MPGGQSQGVGFGNAGVDDPGGVFGAQDGQSAGGRHGRGEGVERFVLAGQVQEFLPDDVLIAYPGGVFQEAGGAVEEAGVVVEDLFGFGRGKSFSLDGGYVQQFYAGQVFDLLQGGDQLRDVVPVGDLPVGDVEGSEKVVGVDPSEEILQVFFQCARYRIDADGVVVEHDQQVGAGTPGVVQGFEGHARGNRSIADHGDVLGVGVAPELVGKGHAQGGGNRGGTVSGTEGVVRAFSAGGKA